MESIVNVVAETKAVINILEVMVLIMAFIIIDLVIKYFVAYFDYFVANSAIKATCYHLFAKYLIRPVT